jgi:uncharacterized membrane protein YkvA (DUF1232 family)
MFKNLNKRSIIQSQDGGLVKDVILYAKLIWLLMTDKRVNFFVKLLPIASLIYLVSPIDLVPGVVLPIIGALDDAAVIWIGTALFMNLCPEDVIEEHLRSLHKRSTGSWQDRPGEPEIVDAEARDITGEQSK